MFFLKVFSSLAFNAVVSFLPRAVFSASKSFFYASLNAPLRGSLSWVSQMQPLTSLRMLRVVCSPCNPWTVVLLKSLRHSAKI